MCLGNGFLCLGVCRRRIGVYLPCTGRFFPLSFQSCQDGDLRSNRTRLEGGVRRRVIVWADVLQFLAQGINLRVNRSIFKQPNKPVFRVNKTLFRCSEEPDQAVRTLLQFTCQLPNAVSRRIHCEGKGFLCIASSLSSGDLVEYRWGQEATVCVAQLDDSFNGIFGEFAERLNQVFDFPSAICREQCDCFSNLTDLVG